MQGTDFIQPRQIKAARALLDWSQEDLASAAQLSIATIRKLETGYISPRHSTTNVIRQAIEGAGLEFIAHDGVRRRPDDMAVYQGAGGVEAFLNDVLQIVRKNPGEDIVISAPENIFAKGAGLYGGLEQIAASCAACVKCLLTDVLNLPAPVSRFEFRTISRHYVDPIPFWVYGDKYAIVTTDANAPKIIAIQSFAVAQSSRRHFLSMWEKGAGVK